MPELLLVGYVSDALTKWLPEAVGHVTGANAQRKMLMDQNAAAREEAQRQAKQSDALAKEAGSDPTNIFLRYWSKRTTRR